MWSHCTSSGQDWAVTCIVNTNETIDVLKFCLSLDSQEQIHPHSAWLFIANLFKKSEQSFKKTFYILSVHLGERRKKTLSDTFEVKCMEM